MFITLRGKIKFWPSEPPLDTTEQYLSSRFMVKLSKKLSLQTSYYASYLITKTQSGFRPGNFATNQLNDLVDEIHQAFDSKEPLEVRAVFLDISKALCGMAG